MAIKLVYGNLLSIHHGIICHQVNCQYAMGAGLAAQIRRAYPKHYADFMSRYAHLGGVCITEINSDFYIIGIYGQDFYGRKGIRYTNYEALKNGFAAVEQFAQTHNLPVYIPYKIGCGLAGGDWQVVYSIIENTISDATIVKR